MLRIVLALTIVVVIIVASVLVITALPISAFYTSSTDGQSNSINIVALTVFYIAISVITYLLVLILLISTAIRFFGFLYRVIFGVSLGRRNAPQSGASEALDKKSIFGETPTIRLIGFGIATILFSDVVLAIVRGLLLFTVEMMRGTPDIIITQWINALDFCWSAADSVSIATCYTGLGFGFLQTWVTAVRNAYEISNFELFDFVRLILFIIAWVLSGTLLSLINPDETNKRSETKLRQRVSEIFKSTLPHNFLFFAILIMGIYLSLVAVISIPLIQPGTSDSDAPTTEQLEKKITEVAEQQYTLEVPYDPIVGDPFDTLTVYLSSQPEVGDPSLSQNSVRATNLYNLQIWSDYYQTRRNTLVASYSTLEGRTSSGILDVGNQAVDIYGAETLNRVGSRENARFHLNVLDWYRTQASWYQERFFECSYALQATDQAWEDWSQRGRQFIEDEQAEPFQYFDETANSNAENAESICRFYSSSIIMDNSLERPSLGTFSGAFGVIARWLLDTESLELGLIVGLIGFGTLGATVSRFVREQRRRSNGILVEGLIGVMLRGVVAAVLVFLIAKSGLGIYDTSESGTQISNPYLVLLLCLIAGVYSEVVWAWAQKFIERQLPPIDSNQSGASIIISKPPSEEAQNAILKAEKQPTESEDQENTHEDENSSG
jgi:hypothetical protein